MTSTSTSKQIGKVALTPAGNWDNTNEYEKLDVVYYQGGSYVAKKAVPVATNITNEEYWQTLAEKAPNLTIGTVNTVSADIGASASIGGTADAPVLNLSIPRGVAGNESIDDTKGFGDTDYVWSADKSTKQINDRTLFSDTVFPSGTFRKGYAINSVGRYTTETNSVCTKTASDCPFVYAGTKITAKTGYKFSYSLWSVPIVSTASVDYRIAMQRNISAGTTITIAEDGYLGLSMAYADDSALPDKTADEFATDALTIELNLRTVKAEIERLTAYDANVEKLKSFANRTNNGVSLLQNEIVISKNVFKNTGYTSGYYINKNNGALVENASYNTSDYFVVKPNTKYYFDNSNVDICFFDYNKDYISGASKGIGGTLTTPVNTCYARASTNNSVSEWNISEGESFIDTPYFEPYLRTSPYETSPFWKGLLTVNKPDVSKWYECICLKEDCNLFNFAVGSDTAHTGTQYADIITLFDELMAFAESGYITKTAIGTGAGTDINGNAYTIYEYAFVPRNYTNNNISKKHPKILIDCAIHGFEKNSTFGMFSLLYDVVHNWDKHPFLETLRNYVEIRIVPVSNPWGFDNNVRNNYNGVNLNRNFPADDWSYVPSGSDASGEEPLDQPEAEALAGWLQANSDMFLYINTHTNGHYYASGYGESNACMPYKNIGDDYYNKLYNAMKRHIERQTGTLPKEFDILTPSQSQYIGKIQDMNTSGSGYIDQYVCKYLAIALAFTLEGCNQLSITNDSAMYISTGSTKLNAEIFGSMIEEILYEYSE